MWISSCMGKKGVVMLLASLLGSALVHGSPAARSEAADVRTYIVRSMGAPQPKDSRSKLHISMPR
jgi:hypothetical protein